MAFCPKCGDEDLPWSGRCPNCGVYGHLSGSAFFVLGLLAYVFSSMVLCAEAANLGVAFLVAFSTVGLMRISRQLRLRSRSRHRPQNTACPAGQAVAPANEADNGPEVAAALPDDPASPR